MLPLTLLAANKILNLLTVNDALSTAISSNAAASGAEVPTLGTAQILGSFISPDIGDLNLDLTYPRICVYASHAANNQREKFRAFSGVVGVTADVWSSDALEQPTELALHFYVEGIRALYHRSVHSMLTMKQLTWGMDGPCCTTFLFTTTPLSEGGWIMDAPALNPSLYKCKSLI